MPTRVFVSGGSGFVGGAVLRALIARESLVTALVNRGALRIQHSNITTAAGSLFDSAALNRAMEGCDGAIHLVGIIAEDPPANVTFERIHVDGTHAVVNAANRAGIKRFIHMSAVGARPDAPSRYHQTKWHAEQIVRASGMDWTVIRPSMIHGPEGEFTRMAAAWARKRAMPYLFMPYFGGGVLGFGPKHRIQPVFVEDVARAFIDALALPRTIGRVYELAGPTPMTWPEYYRTIARAVTGRNRATLPIPAWYAKLLTFVAPRKLLPFNRDQVLMSQEDNVADIRPFVTDFGWTPEALDEALADYAAKI